MKKLSLMIAALALVLGTSQCKKQENSVLSGEKQHIVLTANNGNDGSKVAGEFVTDALNLTWQDGDVIDVKGGASGTLTLVKGAGTTSATFEGDIEKGSGETIEFTVGNEPSYLSQTGAANFITDSICLVGTSQYKEDGNYTVNMKLPYAVLKLNMSALGTSGALTISVGASTVASVTSVTDPSEVFVAVPADGSQKNYTIGFGGKTATKVWTLAANVFYTKNGSTTGEAIVIEPDAPAAPEGALPGLFTVNSSGKQVYFSEGNLQYVKSTETWQFATNQYDIKETGNVGTNYASAAVQTLFGWGDVTPLKTSQDGSNYSSWTDWGKKIGDGKTWRTLTGGNGGEWEYLLNKRTMKTVSFRYTNKTSGTTIDGKTYNGLFIYPDDYSGDQVGATDGPSTWDDINKAGIVFLPAAGYRDGTSVSNVGSNGYYWSSSYIGVGLAYGLSFRSGNVSPNYGSNCYYGYSVRLVSEN